MTALVSSVGAGTAAAQGDTRSTGMAREVGYVMALLAIMNLPSLGLMQVGIAVMVIGLLLTGLANFRALLLVLFALMPMRPASLTLGTIAGFDLSFNRVCVLVALLCFLAHRTESSRERGVPEPLVRVVLVLAGLDILSVFLGAGAVSASLKRSASELIEVFLFAYVCYRGLSEADFPDVMRAFAVGTVVLCVATIVERVTGVNVLLRFPASSEAYAQLQEWAFERAGVFRVRGSFQNPVYLSGFLPLVAFAGTYLLLVGGRRLLGAQVLLVLALSSMLSVSRTAIYGLGIFGIPVLLWWIAQSWARRLVMSVLLVAALGAITYVVAPDDVQRALGLAFHPSAEEFEGVNALSRLELIKQGVPYALSLNPFGVGFDESGIEATQVLGPDVANFFVGYGLVKGVVWVAWFCVLLGYMLYRLVSRHRAVDWLLAALVLSISATLLSYAEYWITFPAVLAWVLITRDEGASASAQTPATDPASG